MTAIAKLPKTRAQKAAATKAANIAKRRAELFKIAPDLFGPPRDMSGYRAAKFKAADNRRRKLAKIKALAADTRGNENLRAGAAVAAEKLEDELAPHRRIFAAHLAKLRGDRPMSRDLSKPVRRITFSQVVGIVRSREALQAILQNQNPIHSTAQMQFLLAWHRAGWSPARAHIADDDLWFAALRKMLPHYIGKPLQIYRGQLEHETVGMSWSVSEVVAERFALYGTAHLRTIERMKPRPGGVLLTAKVGPEIICAAYQEAGGYYGEGEVIIDPRSVRASPLQQRNDPTRDSAQRAA